MYERRSERLASPEIYRRRLVTSGSVGLALIAISLAIGMAGYSYFEDIGFADAYINASMILSGMGPILSPRTTGGKIFAGTYALYSGLAVLVIAAVMFAPVVHRIMHRFHIEESQEGAPKKDPKAK
jgi:hypothetical protein